MLGGTPITLSAGVVATCADLEAYIIIVFLAGAFACVCRFGDTEIGELTRYTLGSVRTEAGETARCA